MAGREPGAGFALPAIVDTARVVALSPQEPSETGTWSFGTGYLVAPRLVMTAAHVLGEPAAAQGRAQVGARVRVRHHAQRTTAAVLWSELDVALLEIDDPAWAPPVGGGCRWGRFTTAEPNLPCSAVGYPLSQVPTGAHRDGHGQERTAEQLFGHINPITGQPIGSQTAGRYAVSVDDTTPITTIPGHQPWEGASGSAVVCGAGLVVGVIVTDELAYQHGRLTAVRVERLAAVPGFRAAIAAHAGGPPYVESVELTALLVEPARVRAGAPPVDLLRAEHGTVGFLGRERELAELHAWCDDGPGLSAFLLYGVGGQGKTRLAQELIRRQRDGGWLAGELRRGLDPDRLWPLGAVTGPALFVVDYAETATPASIDAVIRPLAGYVGPHPVRLLLLARTAGEWWDELRARLLPDAEAARLPGLELSAEGRAAAYAGAAADFAAAKNTTSKSGGGTATDWPALAAALPVPELGGERYASVLSLHMRALADLLQAGPDPVRGAPAAPEDILLAHEQRYWTAYWAERIGFPAPWHPGLLRRLVAAATLYGAGTRAQAITLIRMVPGWADERPNVWEFAADWLHETYPSATDGYLGGLQPDPLGEYLVALAVRAHPELVTTLLPASGHGQLERGLTVLSRVAADSSPGFEGSAEVRDLLVATVAAAPGELSAAAVAVAVRAERPEPLVAGLYAALDRLRTGSTGTGGTTTGDTATGDAATGDADLILAEIAGALPPLTAVLAEFAVALFAALVERLRKAVAAAAGDGGADGALLLAEALAALSFRLSNVGRHTEALTAAEEAGALLERPGGPDPEVARDAWLVVLTSLGLAQQNLGRFDDAARTYRRNLDLLRGAAVLDPEVDRVQQAVALSSLSVVLGLTGEQADARAAAVEASDLLGELAPDNEFTPILLSQALLIMAVTHISADQPEPAVECLTDAVAILRRGMTINPDLYAWSLGLALFLLAGALSLAEQNTLARVHLDESVGLMRRLNLVNSGLITPQLAIALNLRSVVLSELGLDEEALAPAIETAAIYRRTLDAQAGTAAADATEEELAAALTALVDRLEQLDRYGEMERESAAALAVYRRLSDRDPAAFRSMVARLLLDHGTAVANQRSTAEALVSMNEAVAIYRDLFAADPGAYRLRYAGALRRTAGLHIISGSRPIGNALLDEAEREFRIAAAGDRRHLERLAEVLAVRASVHRSEAQFEQASPPAAEAAEVYRGLIAEGRTALAPELCGPLAALATAAAMRGGYDEAIALIDESVAICRQQAATDDRAVHPLADALTVRSGILVDAGRAPEAVDGTEEAIRLLRPAADARLPMDYSWMTLIGAVAVHALALAATGRHAAALDAATESLQRLVDQEQDLEPFGAARAGILQALGPALAHLLSELSEPGETGEPDSGYRAALVGAAIRLTQLCMQHDLLNLLPPIVEPIVGPLRELERRNGATPPADIDYGYWLSLFLILALLLRIEAGDLDEAAALRGEAARRMETVADAASRDELGELLTEADERLGS